MVPVSFSSDYYRDTIDIEKWGSIKGYMQSIGNMDYIILLISDAYLKSANCMYEVLEVMRDRSYRDKIFLMEFYKRIVTTIHSSKGLQYKQVILNSENFVWRGAMNNPEVHYVAITRPEGRLLVLFKQKRENAKIYINILCKQVQKIVIDGVQQHINDVIEIVKV